MIYISEQMREYWKHILILNALLLKVDDDILYYLLGLICNIFVVTHLTLFVPRVWILSMFRGRAQSACVFKLLYLNQIKRFQFQTFRKCSLGSPKTIYYVKDDPVLQVSVQEPSTSSKFFFSNIYLHNTKI